ncbi:MAG: C-GCAxxG-C-C family protein [Bacillota bacterium]
MNSLIKDRVHELYYGYDVNCARTTLTCLSELLETPVERQTMNAAIGLHGAGGFRAQCGLVEGALMFLGLYFSDRGKSTDEIVSLCYRYADEFTKKFGSLTCRELRPGGFSEDDPPHACEGLTCEAIEFAYEFIKQQRQCRLPNSL